MASFVFLEKYAIIFLEKHVIICDEHTVDVLFHFWVMLTKKLYVSLVVLVSSASIYFYLLTTFFLSIPQETIFLMLPWTFAVSILRIHRPGHHVQSWINVLCNILPYQFSDVLKVN
jgi:hypothetical protein